MARKFIAGNGSDSSAAAIEYLKAHRELILPDLYVINPAQNFDLGPGSLAGPYAAYTGDESGYFDQASRKLCWVVSANNLGDIWLRFNPSAGCGQVGHSDIETYSSFEVTINELSPDLTITQVTTYALPCGYNATPSGKLIVTPHAFYVGAEAADGLCRWHKVNRDGSGAPCPAVTTFGGLNNFHDDDWGGYDPEVPELLGICDAAWTSALDLIHVDTYGNVWQFGNFTALLLPNAGDSGTPIKAKAVSDGTNVWVISQPGTSGPGPVISKIHQTPSGPAITNYDLAGSPVDSGVPHDIEYYSADNTILFWLGDTLYKWDIATQTVLRTAHVPFDGGGPVNGGALPNGLNFYDPITLAQLPYSCDGTGLPAYTHGYDFKHQYDALGGIVWLQADDTNVYGVPLAQSGGLGSTPFLLTDYPSSLKWDYKGTFVPAVISRGEVESKIGTDADTLDVTWSPKDTETICGGELTALQGFGWGFFDNAIVEVWRCCMPKPGDLIGSPLAAAKLGDCNTFGAALMFSGRIGEITPDRAKVVMKLVSRMEALNVQVPTNLIEPTNVFAYCSTGIVPDGGASTFTVQAGSSTTMVYADPATETDLYDGGYLVFGSNSKLAGFHARIYQQTVVDGMNALFLAEALPFAPAVGDIFAAYVSMPLDDSGPKYGGFRWVPSPDNSAVVI